MAIRSRRNGYQFVSQFKASTSVLPNATLIELSGMIDEEADLDKIDIGDSISIIVDLQNVTRINSVGIRSWIIWFRKNASNRNLIFRRCPKSIVSQFNIVDGLLPCNAIVESFYVPFYCENCSEESSLLLVNGVGFEVGSTEVPYKANLPNHYSCLSCGKEMGIDIDERIYFKFLRGPNTQGCG